MWKPNWACTICGMLSSRRYSVQRHIMNLHAGFGVVVSYVEYMAGTLAGIYKPNSTLSQSSKRNVKHFDSSHMKNALKFSYSNPFASPTQFGMYPPTRNSPHYYDELNKMMKSSSASASPPDSMTIMRTEFASELGRELARNFLYPTQANIPSFNTNTINKVSQSSLYPIPTIFGYRFQICKDCLLTDPVAVCYSGDGKSARIEYKHGCNPILVASNHEGIDKESSVKTMYEKLPESVINFVNTWTKGKKGLIAIELPKNNNHTDDNIEPEEIIKIKNPKSRQQLITFQYSREQHIDITLTNENQNHWAMRAIKYGQTTLTDCELTDFVRRIKDRTFAVVKVHMPLSTSSSEEQQQESIIRFYFMAIISADDTSSSLPNNDNINNNESSLPYLYY
ncbi:MAG TPA: hypothetical protein VE076_13695 [Nitrososphaeraceae archaeon]|nr:hypothetical protein [Nitrososphaeraceae archaeon]